MTTETQPLDPETQPELAVVPNDFDDDDDVVLDQGTVNRSAGSSSDSDDDDESGFEPIELPKPTGIRPGYVKEMKVIKTRDDERVLVVQIQIADANFPVSDANRPIDLRIKQHEMAKCKAIAAVLGLDMADFKSKAGLAKGTGVHCRVFVTTFKDRLQVANFLPSWAKQGDDNASYFAHVHSLGIDEAAYKKFYDNFCGLLPAE